MRRKEMGLLPYLLLALAGSVILGSTIGLLGAWDVKISKLPQMPETTKARVIHKDLK